MRTGWLLATALGAALAGCATTPEGPPGQRDGVYQGVGPAQGACPPAIMSFTVDHNLVRGEVKGDQEGGFSGSIDPVDGTGFIKFRGDFSTLEVRSDGFEATLKIKCGRLKVEGRRTGALPAR